jgi:hypothetical protein
LTWANSAHRSHLWAIRFQLALVSGSREAPAVYSHWAAYRINSSEGTIGQTPLCKTRHALDISGPIFFRLKCSVSKSHFFQAHHLATTTWHLTREGQSWVPPRAALSRFANCVKRSTRPGAVMRHVHRVPRDRAASELFREAPHEPANRTCAAPRSSTRPPDALVHATDHLPLPILIPRRGKLAGS